MIIPDEPGFYIVVTDSFIYEDRVYAKGELIPREKGQLDYCLGTGLVKIYEPEGAHAPVRSSGFGERFMEMFSRKPRRAN